MAIPLDEIKEAIRKLDVNDTEDLRIKKFAEIREIFSGYINDEQSLDNFMIYMNKAALEDSNLTKKYAMFIAERRIRMLSLNEYIIRRKMLILLEKDCEMADTFRREEKNVFYNLIVLLGEYHKHISVHIINDNTFLCKQVLIFLTEELKIYYQTYMEERIVNQVKFAELVASQISLNGEIMKNTFKEELDLLLYEIRRILIELPNLEKSVKALFMMTLDLAYYNFRSLGVKLESMYSSHTRIIEQIYNENKCLQNESKQNLTRPKKCIEEVAEAVATERLVTSNLKSDLSVHDSEEFTEVVNSHRSQSVKRTHDGHPIKVTSEESKSGRSNHRSNYDRYLNYDDEDRENLHHEGGTLRLYSVNDQKKQYGNQKYGPSTNRFDSYKPRENYNFYRYNESDNNKQPMKAMSECDYDSRPNYNARFQKNYNRTLENLSHNAKKYRRNFNKDNTFEYSENEKDSNNPRSNNRGNRRYPKNFYKNRGNRGRKQYEY